MDLGTALKQPETPQELFAEIRRGFIGADDNSNSNAVLKKVNFNKLETVNYKELKSTKAKSAYLQNYLQLGDALAERGAELTRDALD